MNIFLDAIADLEAKLYQLKISAHCLHLQALSALAVVLTTFHS